MQYPPPDQNPLCQCKGNTLRAFWCRHGHLLECHYPYTCREAACSHIDHLHPAERERLQQAARTALAEGRRAPYYLDETGKVRISEAQSAVSKPPTG